MRRLGLISSVTSLETFWPTADQEKGSQTIFMLGKHDIWTMCVWHDPILGILGGMVFIAAVIFVSRC